MTSFEIRRSRWQKIQCAVVTALCLGAVVLLVVLGISLSTTWSGWLLIGGASTLFLLTGGYLLWAVVTPGTITVDDTGLTVTYAVIFTAPERIEARLVKQVRPIEGWLAQSQAYRWECTLSALPQRSQVTLVLHSRHVFRSARRWPVSNAVWPWFFRNPRMVCPPVSGLGYWSIRIASGQPEELVAALRVLESPPPAG